MNLETLIEKYWNKLQGIEDQTTDLYIRPQSRWSKKSWTKLDALITERELLEEMIKDLKSIK